MADATGTQCVPPATPWLPRRQTTQIRHRATLFVLALMQAGTPAFQSVDVAGEDACAPVAFENPFAPV